jgi:hypothetical protein
LKYMPRQVGAPLRTARRYFSDLWGVDLQCRSVDVAGTVPWKFDLVSLDQRYVGDAKWLKTLRLPAAKWQAIAEFIARTPEEGSTGAALLALRAAIWLSSLLIYSLLKSILGPRALISLARLSFASSTLSWNGM